MGESDEPQAAGRLGELEEVTREYGRYSQLSGLPLAALGAWVLVGAVVLRWVGDGPARLLMLALPLAWVAFVLASARLYQRRGVVVTTTKSAKRWTLLLVYLFVALLLASLHDASWYEAVLPRTLVLVIAVAALAAVLVTAHSRARDGFGNTAAFLVLMWALPATHDRSPSHLLGTHAFIGACLVLAGLYWHLRFRRLERRILALREHGA